VKILDASDAKVETDRGQRREMEIKPKITDTGDSLINERVAGKADDHCTGALDFA